MSKREGSLEAKSRPEDSQAADLLRASEDRFRTLAAATYEGIAFSEGGVVIDANHQMAEMLGFTSVAELVGKTAMEFTAPEHRKRVENHIRSGSEEAYEHLAQRADGTIFPVLARGRAIDLGGRPVRVTAIRDLTEQKQAEGALRVSERRFRTVFEEAPLAIAVGGPDDRILDVNEEMCNLLGYTSDELVGMRAADFVHPEDMAGVLRLREEAFELETPTYRTEMRVIGKREETLWVSGAVSIVRAEPEELYAIVMFQDITERKLTQDRLKSLLAEREQLVKLTLRAQEDERRNVAHDIHDGPTQRIVAAGMYMDAFQRDRRFGESADVEAELAASRSHLESAVAEIRRIIADLRPAALDDLGLAGALRGHINELGRSTGIRVTLRTDLDEERLAPVVESTLFRVAQEAINNAIKHSGSERILVSLLKTQSGVSLTVTDWGEGFDPTAVVGTGGASERVGLIGMRERAELIGGSFRISSEMGWGTKVNVRTRRH